MGRVRRAWAIRTYGSGQTALTRFQGTSASFVFISRCDLFTPWITYLLATTSGQLRQTKNGEMVYYGAVSKGCQNCRRRKVKVSYMIFLFVPPYQGGLYC